VVGLDNTGDTSALTAQGLANLMGNLGLSPGANISNQERRLGDGDRRHAGLRQAGPEHGRDRVRPGWLQEPARRHAADDAR
jgi:hypothetical protein